MLLITLLIKLVKKCSIIIIIKKSIHLVSHVLISLSPRALIKTYILLEDVFLVRVTTPVDDPDAVRLTRLLQIFGSERRYVLFLD